MTSIEQEAKQELEAEFRREKVEKVKENLRRKARMWRSIRGILRKKIVIRLED